MYLEAGWFQGLPKRTDGKRLGFWGSRGAGDDLTQGGEQVNGFQWGGKNMLLELSGSLGEESYPIPLKYVNPWTCKSGMCRGCSTLPRFTTYLTLYCLLFSNGPSG